MIDRLRLMMGNASEVRLVKLRGLLRAAGERRLAPEDLGESLAPVGRSSQSDRRECE